MNNEVEDDFEELVAARARMMRFHAVALHKSAHVFDDEALAELAVLKKLAAGAISLIDATAQLKNADAGHTLQQLMQAGMTMPKLDDEMLRAQSVESLEAMRSALRK